MKKNPEIRYLNDMKEVLYDQGWAKSAPNVELYYMHRGLKYEQGLRYDITIIPFQMLGKEFVKTKGHEHPAQFAELYKVLEGQAIFLLQKCSKNRSRNVNDVYAVRAEKNDKVFVPPGYGHITINPGPEPLKMSNWVAANFKSDYSLFIKKQGACYLAIARKSKVKNQKSKVSWIKNKHYTKVPKLRFEKPNKDIPKDLRKALLGRDSTTI